MSTPNIQKLNNRLTVLQKEVRLLRSTLVSMVQKDKEGEYNPEFIERMLAASKEKPTRAFINARSFLADLNKI